MTTKTTAAKTKLSKDASLVAVGMNGKGQQAEVFRMRPRYVDDASPVFYAAVRVRDPHSHLVGRLERAAVLRIAAELEETLELEGITTPVCLVDGDFVCYLETETAEDYEAAEKYVLAAVRAIGFRMVVR